MAPRKPRSAAAVVGLSLDTDTTIEDATASGEQAEPFARVYSASIKGGFDTPLSACTAIVGANRAGKTAVLDAIRLALTGQHPVGPHYADLLALTSGKPPDAHLIGPSAEAHVLTASGRKSLDVAHSGALAGLSTSQQAALLPLTSVRDLLALGNDKARETIFARFGSGMAAVPVPPGLDDGQTQLWITLSEQTTGGDAASRLSSMGSLLRSHKLSCGKLAKAAEDEAEGLREQAPSVPATQAELDQLEREHAAAIAYSRSESTRLQLAQARTARNAAESTPVLQAPPEVQLAGQMAPIETELVAVDTELEARQRQLGAARVISKMREKLADRSLKNCTVCAQPVSDAAAHVIAGAPNLEEAVIAQIQTLQVRKSELVGAKNSLAALAQRTASEIHRVQQHNAQREQKIAMLNSVLQNLEAALRGVEDPGVTVEQAQDALRQANAGRVAATRINDALLRARKIRREADDCKVLEKSASALLSQLVAGVAAKAEAAVRKYLPSDAFAARLALEDAEGKPACRWEVRGSDGTYHPFGAASGAEWGALTVALGCAWSEGAPVRVLLLDDADLAPLSPENVFALLNMVQERVEAGDLTQAVVAWCRPEEVPEGWTVVRR